MAAVFSASEQLILEPTAIHPLTLWMSSVIFDEGVYSALVAKVICMPL